MWKSHQHGQETSELVSKVAQKYVRRPGPGEGLKGRGKSIRRYQHGPTWYWWRDRKWEHRGQGHLIKKRVESGLGIGLSTVSQ